MVAKVYPSMATCPWAYVFLSFGILRIDGACFGPFEEALAREEEEHPILKGIHSVNIALGRNTTPKNMCCKGRPLRPTCLFVPRHLTMLVSKTLHLACILDLAQKWWSPNLMA